MMIAWLNCSRLSIDVVSTDQTIWNRKLSELRSVGNAVESVNVPERSPEICVQTIFYNETIYDSAEDRHTLTRLETRDSLAREIFVKCKRISQSQRLTSYVDMKAYILVSFNNIPVAKGCGEWT